MAQTVLLRRSAVTNNVPTTTALQLGELAINTYDGRMFFKKNNGSDAIVEVATSSSIKTVNGNSLFGSGDISISGTVTGVDDTSTNTTYYPVMTSTINGSVNAKTSSTELSFNPSTGILFTKGLTANSSLFTLQDTTDNTKKALFNISGNTTATTRTYSLPDTSSTLVDLDTTQTIVATKTLSNANQNIGSAITTGTINLGYGSITNGVTRAINIGTGGLSGSVNNTVIGSNITGATNNLNIFGTTTHIGQFGIGGTPLVDLHINSSISAVYNRLQGASDGSNYCALELWNSGGTSKWQFAHKSTGQVNAFAFNHYNGTSWSQPLTIFDSGNLGINTTTDASYKLDVNGSSRISDGLTLGVISNKAPITFPNYSPSSPTSGDIWFDGTNLKNQNGTVSQTFLTNSNVKTINGSSIFGSGDILVSGTLPITNDSTTNATYYPTFLTTSTGNASGIDVSSTKLTFNPSTGTLTSTIFSGNGSGLTSIPNSALTNNTISGVSLGSNLNSNTIKFDTGTTEGTDLYTYNGSTAKTVNIVAGTNVTLTKAAGQITINAAGGSGSPAGTSGSIQYNNGGAFAGAVNADIDNGDIQITYNPTPVTPPAGNVKLFCKQYGASRMIPAAIGPSGMDYALQPSIWRQKVGLWAAVPGATTLPGVWGIGTLTAVGTATARTIATTNLMTRRARLGYVSAATAGSLASTRTGIAAYSAGNGAGLGGFYHEISFNFSDAAAVTGVRSFIGLWATTSAPTNVEPNTLVNAIGVAQLSTDSTQLYLCYGGSAAQTAIALGTGFPPYNGTVGITTGVPYRFSIWAPPSTSTFNWQLERLDTGTMTSGTLAGTAGTAYPANTTLLSMVQWRCNNATALAVGYDITSIYIETDY